MRESKDLLIALENEGPKSITSDEMAYLISRNNKVEQAKGMTNIGLKYINEGKEPSKSILLVIKELLGE